MAEALAEIKACLREIPLFRPLSQEELEELAPHVRVEKHDDEKVLFHQGDPGDSYYIVKDGEVEITITLKSGTDEDGNPKTKKIRKIVEGGGSFGEMSLLTGANRAGDAKVCAHSELLVIDKAPFREYLLAHQSIAAELGATMLRLMQSNRSAEANEDADTKPMSAYDDEDGPPSVIIDEIEENEDTLLKKIRNFFGLT